MTTRRHLAIALSLVAALLACAGAETPAPEADASTVNSGTNNAPNNASNNAAEDIGEPDIAEDISEPDVPVEPDLPIEEEEPDPCGVCCPAERSCVDEQTAGACAPDGQSVLPEPCEEGEVCREGQCGPPPISCTPGESVCLDLTTSQTCNARGDAYTTRTCSGGMCMGGACVTGAETGEACALNTDCAGGECLCRDGDTCTGGPGTTWAAGYCTASDCGATGCLAGEECVDLSVAMIGPGGQHCIKNCIDCNNIPGYACQEVPSRQGLRVEWREACFPTGLKDFGQFCVEGAECLGGTCLRSGDWPVNGYCAMPCSADIECPAQARCVAFLDGQSYCGVVCGDGRPGTGSCPEGLGLDVSCQNKVDVHSGSLVSVCAPR